MSDHSSNFSAEYLPGGALRVSAVPAVDTQPPTVGDQSRVHYGVVREDGSGQLIQDRGEFVPLRGGGVMATLRNNAGGQRIDATSTVEIEGMRTSLAVAAELGYVREVSPGRWEDSMPAEQQPQDTRQEEQTDPDVPFCDHATEAEFQRAAADVPQHAVEPALAGAAVAATDVSEAGWARVAHQLSGATGIDVDAAFDLVQQGYDVFEGRVSRLAASQGITGDAKVAFYDWAREHKPQELQQAVNKLTLEGSLDGFRGLITQHKAAGGQRQLAFWRNAGMDAYVDRDTGEVMVSRGGGRAVRASDLLKG